LSAIRHRRSLLITQRNYLLRSNSRHVGAPTMPPRRFGEGAAGSLELNDPPAPAGGIQERVRVGPLSRPDLNDPPAPAGGIQERVRVGPLSRLDLNDPPASAGGIQERVRVGPLSRLDLNDPPASAGGIQERVRVGPLSRLHLKRSASFRWWHSWDLLRLGEVDADGLQKVRPGCIFYSR